MSIRRPYRKKKKLLPSVYRNFFPGSMGNIHVSSAAKITDWNGYGNPSLDFGFGANWGTLNRSMRIILAASIDNWTWCEWKSTPLQSKTFLPFSLKIELSSGLIRCGVYGQYCLWDPDLKVKPLKRHFWGACLYWWTTTSYPVEGSIFSIKIRFK